MQTLKPITHQVQQRTEEWFQLRLGKVTGSKVGCVLEYFKPTKAQLAAAMDVYTKEVIDLDRAAYLYDNSPSEYCLQAGIELTPKAERENYKQNLVGERLTKLPADPEPYVSYDMKWGMVNEDIAKTVYQMQKKCILQGTPIYEHPELKALVSPDDNAVDTASGELINVEIKNLRTANHLYKIIKTQEMPEDYKPQVQMQMWLSGLSSTDFIGFDSRLKRGLNIFVQRVPIDNQYVEWVLEPGIRRFLAECDRDFKYFWAKLKEDK